MKKCIHANKLHDNLWCNTACMYCTLSQEETCRHKKYVPGTNVVNTNADHIRSMTDEELVVFIEDVFEAGRISVFAIYPELTKNRCGADWLRQPYKEAT